MVKLNSVLKSLIGEYRVASELARIGFLTTTFSKNIKDFDIIAINPEGKKSLKIQVKTITYRPTKEGKIPQSIGYPFDAKTFFEIDFQESRQIIKSEKEYKPNYDFLIFFVMSLDDRKYDKFFVIKPKQLAKIIRKDYSSYIKETGGKRKRNYNSTDTRFFPAKQQKFEDNNLRIKFPLSPYR